MLQCKRVDENLQSKMVVGTIADLPANVTHLKIDCYRLHRFVLLTFVGLHRVRSLTVSNIKLSTLGLFHGVDNISRLVLQNVSLKHMGNDSFQGLRQLLSLTLDHLDELEYMHTDVLKPLLLLQSLSFRHIGLPYNAYPGVLGGIASCNFQSLTLHGIRSAGNVELNTLLGNWSRETPLKRLELADNSYRAVALTDMSMVPPLQHMSLTGNVTFSEPTYIHKWLSYFISNPSMKTLEMKTKKKIALEQTMHNAPLCSLEVSSNITELPVPLHVVVGPLVESISLSEAVFLVEPDYYFFF